MTREDQATRIFLAEAVSQIDTALRAERRASAALHAADDDGFWDALDQVLTSSIRCVNIFWTKQSGAPRQRARRLRDYLGLADAPLSPTLRDVRNSFEHFDERIDEWAARSLGGYVGRVTINTNAPLSQLVVVGDGTAPQHEYIARVYHATGNVQVFSKEVSLPTLIGDLKALRAILMAHLG